MTHRHSALQRRVSVLLACAGGMLITSGVLAPPAYANTPQRVGWWNTASASGSAAPSPTTPAGGMRVAAGPLVSGLPVAVPQGPQILAYGAVLYALAEGDVATLQLKVAGGATGTPQLAACPTANERWTAGDDQPASAEPAYDCSAQHFSGKVSSDGSTVSFTIASPFETTPGVISLAIVPDPSSTAAPTGSTPFAVDIQPPDAGSFVSLGAAPEPTAAVDFWSPGVSLPVPAGPPVSAGAPVGLPIVSAPPPAAAAVAPSPPPSQRSAPAPQATPIRSAVATPPSALRMHLATALGAAMLLVAAVVWSLGFGLLGGRVIPLSVPLRRE